MITFKNNINARQFFERYAPTVTNYVNKSRGKNGRGAPIDWTDEDKKAILSGLERMVADIKKEIKK